VCACRRNAAAEEGKPKSAYKHLRSSDADLRPRYAGEDKYVRLGASPADLRSLARRYRDHAAENFFEGPADATVLWRHFKEKAYGQIQSRMRPAAGNQRAQTRNVPGCASPGSPPLVRKLPKKATQPNKPTKAPRAKKTQLTHRGVLKPQLTGRVHADWEGTCERD
jgi:hypothetical protein